MSFKRLTVSLILAAAAAASASAATTTWTGAASSDWSDVGNWNATVPLAGDTVNIPAVARAPVLSTVVPSATTRFATVSVNGTLTIGSSGGLYVTNYSQYTGSSVTVNGILDIGTGISAYWYGGTLTVDGASARVSINRRPEFGLCTVNVKNGGRISQTGGSAAFFILGRAASAPTTMNINGSGSMVLCNDRGTEQLWWRYTPYGVVDIKNGGLFRMNNSMTNAVANVASGKVISSDPREIVTLTQYSASLVDALSVRQKAAYDLVPVNNAILTPGTITFSWKKTYSENLTNTLTSTVRMGTYTVDSNGLPTDPNGDSLPIVAGPGLTATTITHATGDAKYQWRVDLYDPNTKVTTSGTPQYFTSGNQPPVVNAGTLQYLGLRNGTVNFASNASYADDGLPTGGPVTYLWELVSGPAVTISPNNTLNITQALTQAGTYVFQVTVNDGQFSGSKQVTINVYANKCLSAQATPGYVGLASDLNNDCAVNIKDFAIIASNWRKCTSLNPSDPVCSQ